MQATINVDESNTECTSIEEEGAGFESPFIVKKRLKKSLTRSCKKKKLDKSTSTVPLVLTEGDLDKIGYMVYDATTYIWGHFEEQYQQKLSKVQQGMREL